ncbi:TolC family protein [Acerihabitans sp. TG2]|uniref:TolC family protein n=1 Tax=Acerihabitans sp. TG2 TaxID=3096008 RepID=UPI002B235451|nr:TolC family protein [Acerihabitans sp. TG2]MEA9392871.1 TolC family protein [Acerihabitans sp. TG2]
MLKPCSLRAWLALMLFISTATPAAQMTLDEALTLAEHYSADLSANLHQRQALENQADSAMQLPDPKLKFGIDNLPVDGNNARRFTRENMTMQRIGLMQEYVSSTKRERKADAFRAQAAATAAGYQNLRAGLQRDTAQAWLELALAQKAVTAAQNVVAESERQIAVQRAAVAGGGSASAVLERRLVVIDMRDALTDTQRDVAVAQARLTQLTGVTRIQTEGHLPHFERLPADPTVLTQGITQHPEIVQARREAQVSQARAAQSAVAAIPDVGIDVYYGKRDAGRDDVAGIMFTVDLPLFQSQRQDKDHSADRARIFEANDRLALTVRDHTAQLDTLVAQYQAAQTRWLRQKDEVLPLQTQRLQLTQAQYRSGSATLTELLAARRALLASELNENRAAREVAQNWAAIQYLIPQEKTL